MNARPSLGAAAAAAAPHTTRFGQAGRHLVRLDDERVARYYLGHLAVAHTRRARWGAMLRPVLEAARGWFGVQTFRPAVAPAAPLPPAWEAPLARAAALVGGLGALEPGIVIHDYAGAGRQRTLFFLFDATAPAPVALLKTRPTAATGKPLSVEWDALRLLAERLPRTLASTVPVPLSYGGDAEAEALLVSVLAGASGYVELHRTIAPARRAEAQLGGAMEWLAAFQESTRNPQHAVDPAALIADGRLRLARAGLTGREEAAALLDGLAELAAGPSLPRVAAHGDFWVRNVLYAPMAREVAVVDWEQFTPLASPVDDLFHFLVSYGVSFPWCCGSRATDAFARTFVAPTPVARAARRVLGEWRERHGLTRHALRALFLLHLLVRADEALPDAPTDGTAFNRSRWLDCYRTIARADRSVFSG